MKLPKWSKKIAIDHIVQMKSPFESQLSGANGNEQQTMREQIAKRIKGAITRQRMQ